MNLQDLCQLKIKPCVLDDSVMVNVNRLIDEKAKGSLTEKAELLISLGLTEQEVVGIFLRGAIEVDMEVELKEPMWDSAYNESFVGTVTNIKDNDMITVRDGEDNHFDVEYHEILSLII